MPVSSPINVFWFRRDLRLHDNTGLFQALKSGLPVQCVFIFDTNILDKLEDKHDARLVFIHQRLVNLNTELNKYGAGIITFYGSPEEAWGKWSSVYNIRKVYTNCDYEPYARRRDESVSRLLASRNIEMLSFKDHVIFEKSEVVKDDGKPYTVFTPYKNRYLKLLGNGPVPVNRIEKFTGNFVQSGTEKIIRLSQMGFKTFPFRFPSSDVNSEVIKKYTEMRDFPGENGTSRISVHLRFGTVSIRELANLAIKLKSASWLNELIWRDFYQSVLWHFPHVSESAFKPAYDKIPWRNNEKEFSMWCEGKTGYPIVDAGMRELNSTGFMHNRVRMITASFLVKHLLIDWRWGEAYFAKKLIDFDLASNNGGWQWAASSGCDAAPYFRIFNPSEQTKRFDPDFKYIRKWVPEFESLGYPEPMVDHKFARERCLKVYGETLNKLKR